MRRFSRALLFVLTSALICHAVSNVKIRGYVTARPNPETLFILDDAIHLSPSTHFDLHNSAGAAAKSLTLAEISPGTLIEVEGKWSDLHQFNAEKITCDAEQFERLIHGHAYLQTEPAEIGSDCSRYGDLLDLRYCFARGRSGGSASGRLRFDRH